MVTTSASSALLRRAWVATGASFVLVFAGMLVVPRSEQGSVVSLIGALILLGAGMAALSAAFVFSIRAMRQSRSLAIVPLLLSAFVMFFGLVATLAAFGRFYGWDG